MKKAHPVQVGRYRLERGGDLLSRTAAGYRPRLCLRLESCQWILGKRLEIVSVGKPWYLQITGTAGRSDRVEVLDLGSERAVFSAFAKLNGDAALGSSDQCLSEGLIH